MNNVVINDRLPQFSRNLVPLIDSAMKELSYDIIIESREIAPKKRGNLRANSFPVRKRVMKWRVEFNQKYALYQEVGRAGSRVFRNYTTPGTGSRFLKKSGDKVFKEALITLRKYMRHAR